MHTLFKWDERISWQPRAVQYCSELWHLCHLEESNFSQDEFRPKAKEDRTTCDLDDSCGYQTIWEGAFIPAGSVSVPSLGVGSPACGGDEVWAGSLMAHLGRRHLGVKDLNATPAPWGPGYRRAEAAQLWATHTRPFLGPRALSMQKWRIMCLLSVGLLRWRSQCEDGTESQSMTHSHCGTIYSKDGKSTLWTQTAPSTSSIRKQTRGCKSFGIWAFKNRSKYNLLAFQLSSFTFD